MIPGQQHAQEMGGATSVALNGEEGQCGVNHSKRNAENSQEAFGDVASAVW